MQKLEFYFVIVQRNQDEHPKVKKIMKIKVKISVKVRINPYRAGPKLFQTT